MSTTPAAIELRPLPAPAALDSADAADFIEMVRVRNIVYREISGHDDHAITPEQLLPAYADDPDTIRLQWLAVLDGEVVGRVGIDIPQEEGSRVAFVRIELRRSGWRHGIGRRAHALLEETARAHGRTVLQSWVEHPADAALAQLAAPTGFGSIPADRGAVFAQRAGYTLEQVERISVLDLTSADARVRALLDTARAASEDYDVVHWFLPTPAEFVPGYAEMKARMVTDAPAAGIEFDEEVWDAERLARHERTYLDGGTTMLVTAARHRATGDLVAFNELTVGPDRTRASHQEDTLVLADHRGHRLGMLVKCAGILRWRELAPDSPRIITYNAEENRPMLDINEAIGFAPIAYEGAWKRVEP